MIYLDPALSARTFVCNKTLDAALARLQRRNQDQIRDALVAPAPQPRVGVEYYSGKAKPHRAYYEIGGVKTYAGYFKLEADAWDAANRAAQAPTLAPLAVPLAVVPIGASDETVCCPVCDRWARQEGNRFYHLEVLDLVTHVRDEARSLWCEFPTYSAPLPNPTENDLNELYLTVNAWEQTTLDGINTAWEDPIGGGSYVLENALGIQTARDARDELAFSW